MYRLLILGFWLFRQRRYFAQAQQPDAGFL